VRATKRLPLDDVAPIVPLGRKELELWQKYVLAVVVALAGDFPYVSGHFQDRGSGV